MSTIRSYVSYKAVFSKPCGACGGPVDPDQCMVLTDREASFALCLQCGKNVRDTSLFAMAILEASEKVAQGHRVVFRDVEP